MLTDEVCLIIMGIGEMSSDAQMNESALASFSDTAHIINDCGLTVAVHRHYHKQSLQEPFNDKSAVHLKAC